MIKPDWTPSGLRTYYYEDGVTKRYEGNYSSGIKQGEFKYWDRNGQLRAVITYQDGIITGTPILYDTNGTHQSVVYSFDLGILQDSVHYNNGNIIGVYNYEDKNRYDDPTQAAPPPVGTLWQGDASIGNPAEIFRNTVWTYVNNAFYIDDSGATKEVKVWLREPDSTGGSSNYGPFLLMHDFTEMREDGSILDNGEYTRVLNDEVSTSVITGLENLWDGKTGMVLTNCYWNLGDQTKMEILQSTAASTVDQRVWQEVLVVNDKATTGWFAAYDIKEKIHSIPTPTYRYTFDQNTQVATIDQYKQDTLG